ncbi:MAG TPA: hypothetical protein VK983_04040 [Candidatus Limnocylindrales bacterium]|nr:hypothetical protein [Candidatus Limnocylindrales bacterium]
MRQGRELLAAGVTAAALVGLAGCGDQEPSIEISAINGVELERDKITEAGDLRVLPSTRSESGPYRPEAEEVAILTGLKSIEALRAWKLCGAELRASADAGQSIIDSKAKYPRNLPFNYTTERGLELEQDTRKYFEPRITAMRSAAHVADAAGIPCFDPSKKDLYGHYVKIKGEWEGETETFQIPDYSVLRGTLPVEYHHAQGDCPADLDQDLSKAEAIPVDVKPDEGNMAGLTTYTEQDKAQTIARATIRARLLREAGVVCK